MAESTNFSGERIRGDLEDIAILRRLSKNTVDRLARTIAGEFHDRTFLFISLILHAVFVLLENRSASGQSVIRSGTGRILVDFCLDLNYARTDNLAAVFEIAIKSGKTGLLSVTKDGLTIHHTERPFECSWRQVTFGLAVVHFLLIADGLALFSDLLSILDAISSPVEDLAGSIQETARALSRVAYRFRNEHFPEHELLRRNKPLIDFLQSRLQNRGGQVHVSDKAILESWLYLVNSGERYLFETVAKRCIQFECVINRKRARTRLASAGQLDADRDTAGTAQDGSNGSRDDGGHDLSGQGLAFEDDNWSARHDAIEGEGDGPTPLDWVRDIPERPKVLTGAERELLCAVFSLETLYRDRALTVLRAISFGAIHNRMVRKGELPEGLPGRTYRQELDDVDDLRVHLSSVAILAIGQNAPNAPGLPKARRIRRDGFDLPAQDLSAILVEHAEALSGLIRELAAFVSNAAYALVYYDEDWKVFLSALREIKTREGK